MLSHLTEAHGSHGHSPLSPNKLTSEGLFCIRSFPKPTAAELSFLAEGNIVYF